jgi:hypothetical protein
VGQERPPRIAFGRNHCHHQLGLLHRKTALS